MKFYVRRWAVILLLAVLPATLFAQACELGCDLARMSVKISALAQLSMSDCDSEISVVSDANDVCPMAALCDFTHLTALPTVLSFDTASIAPTFGVEPSHSEFSSTSFPPAQRPPSA